MLKWIKVKQDTAPAGKETSNSKVVSKDTENDDIEPEIDVACKSDVSEVAAEKEEEEDSGMEREDSPAIDLRRLKNVCLIFYKLLTP